MARGASSRTLRKTTQTIDSPLFRSSVDDASLRQETAIKASRGSVALLFYVKICAKFEANNAPKLCAVKSKNQTDALLLTGVKDFSTADGNAGGNFRDNAIATRMTTRRQRSSQRSWQRAARLRGLCLYDSAHGD